MTTNKRAARLLMEEDSLVVFRYCYSPDVEVRKSIIAGETGEVERASLGDRLCEFQPEAPDDPLFSSFSLDIPPGKEMKRLVLVRPRQQLLMSKLCLTSTFV